MCVNIVVMISYSEIEIKSRTEEGANYRLHMLITWGT